MLTLSVSHDSSTDLGVGGPLPLMLSVVVVSVPARVKGVGKEERRKHLGIGNAEASGDVLSEKNLS